MIKMEIMREIKKLERNGKQDKAERLFYNWVKRRGGTRGNWGDKEEKRKEQIDEWGKVSTRS